MEQAHAALQAPEIVVANHALERARERFGIVFTRRMIIDEVRDALRDGKVSCHMPRVLMKREGSRRYRNPPGRGKIRYATPPGATYAYLIKRVEGGSKWLVVTVLV